MYIVQDISNILFFMQALYCNNFQSKYALQLSDESQYHSIFVTHNSNFSHWKSAFGPDNYAAGVIQFGSFTQIVNHLVFDYVIITNDRNSRNIEATRLVIYSETDYNYLSVLFVAHNSHDSIIELQDIALCSYNDEWSNDLKLLTQFSNVSAV